MIQLDALKKDRKDTHAHTQTNRNWHVGPVLTSLALDKNIDWMHLYSLEEVLTNFVSNILSVYHSLVAADARNFCSYQLVWDTQIFGHISNYFVWPQVNVITISDINYMKNFPPLTKEILFMSTSSHHLICHLVKRGLCMKAVVRA